MFVLFLFTSYASFAASEDNEAKNWWNGYALDLGVSVKQTSLDVSNSDGEILGSLISKMSYSPVANLGSPYQYFSEGNIGYNFQYNISTFSLKSQAIGDKNSDLGTSAKGFYFYAMPVFFYNYGTKYFSDNGKGHSFKIGTGIGPGYLTADGSLILTNGDNSKYDFTITEKNALTLAVYVLFDYRFNNWTFRARGGGPSTYFRGLQYQLMDLSMDMGYAIRF